MIFTYVVALPILKFRERFDPAPIAGDLSGISQAVKLYKFGIKPSSKFPSLNKFISFYFKIRFPFLIKQFPASGVNIPIALN